MLTQFALIMAIILQLVAALISIRLIRVTKYNLAWMLISIGFILLAFRRFIEYIPFVSDAFVNRQVYIWLGIAASLFFASGLFLIRKIFRYMKKMEEEKRELEKQMLHTIIQTEEGERKRLAKDIHDGLGPLLSTVKMSLTAITRRDSENNSLEILRNADMAIDEAIKSVREISNNLSPHILDNFGLQKAIKNFINKINLTNELIIDFSTNLNNQRFDSDVEVVLYRVICELVTNTLKHAHASKADLTLVLVSETLHGTYHDDGIGFSFKWKERSEPTGMGFSNIISRVSSLNGTFTYEEAVDSGMTAIFSIPIKL